MELGIVVRNMGEASTPGTLVGCARAADDLGIESLWVTDHIAIPPDDAEGSGGRYLDPLTTLAHLAGATRRIRLGTGVLILPYRPALPTVRQLATLQELSGGRLLLGVGVGWMRAEFAALGVDRRRRGALCDEVLDLIRRCFDAGPDDVAVSNGQPFLFRPRPPRPPIYVGGAPPHALLRAVRYADGWMPMGTDPEKLAAPVAQLAERAAEAGRPRPEVVCMGALPLDDPPRARDQLDALEALGVTRLVAGHRESDVDGFRRTAERWVRLFAERR
ncbi:MAG: TIGR03619 family F420-dependent LLM class oxidoreductase [Myxococcota bacterium]